jgi:hypothetical protein
VTQSSQDGVWHFAKLDVHGLRRWDEGAEAGVLDPGPGSEGDFDAPTSPSLQTAVVLRKKRRVRTPRYSEGLERIASVSDVVLRKLGRQRHPQIPGCV